MKLTTVKLNQEIVDRYRKVSKLTLIPISRMIERAMQNWLPVYERTGRELQSDLKRLRHNMQKESGQAILEMALILPIFIGIGLGLIDLQWSLSRATNLEYMVNETARCQAVNPTDCPQLDPAATRRYITRMTGNLRMDPNQLTSTFDCGITTCTATMTYRYKAIGFWFPAITITRQGVASR